MIGTLFIWILVILLIIGGIIITYYLQFFFARRALHQEYQQLQNDISQREHKLAETQRQFEQQKIIELNNINQKKAEAFKEHQSALDKIKIAEKIRETAQTKIKALQQHTNQLQADLYNARRRAERLAKRSRLS